MRFDQATALCSFYHDKVMGKPIAKGKPWPITKVKVVGEGREWGVLCFTEQPLTVEQSWMELVSYLIDNDIAFDPALFNLEL